MPVDNRWLDGRVTVMMCRVNVANRHQISSAGGSTAAGAARQRRPLAGAPESPPATRAAGRTWKDPRLLVGVAVVASCVLLGARMFASADDTVAVWSVRGDLEAGSSVTVAGLERQNLRFGSTALAGRYLSADDPIPTGMVVKRDLAAGELLPRAALGPADEAHLAEVPIAVPLEGVPGTLRAGELVDVWVTPESPTGGSARAVRVLEAVRVVAVPSTGSALGPSTTRQVLVGLPAEEQGSLPSALAQISAGTPVIVRRG